MMSLCVFNCEGLLIFPLFGQSIVPISPKINNLPYVGHGLLKVRKP
jgi:hypothetical protein